MLARTLEINFDCMCMVLHSSKWDVKSIQVFQKLTSPHPMSSASIMIKFGAVLGALHALATKAHTARPTRMVHFDFGELFEMLAVESVLSTEQNRTRLFPPV